MVVSVRVYPETMDMSVSKLVGEEPAIQWIQWSIPWAAGWYGTMCKSKKLGWEYNFCWSWSSVFLPLPSPTGLITDFSHSVAFSFLDWESTGVSNFHIATEGLVSPWYCKPIYGISSDNHVYISVPLFLWRTWLILMYNIYIPVNKHYRWLICVHAYESHSHMEIVDSWCAVQRTENWQVDGTDSSLSLKASEPGKPKAGLCPSSSSQSVSISLIWIQHVLMYETTQTHLW